MNLVLNILLFFLLACSPASLFAQDTLLTEDEHKDTISIKKQIHNVDIIDLVKSLKHKKGVSLDTQQSNKALFSIVPAIGYTLQTGFAGVLSSNVAFYTGNSVKQKISSLLGSISYTQYKQFIVPLQANIWTKDNKYNVLFDWRFMHYPSRTYGLGGSTKLSDGYFLDYSYMKLHQSIFKSIGKDFYAGLGYYFDYIWKIKEVGISSNEKTVFQRYGLTSKEIASGPVFRLLYDSRLNQINPNNGFYSSIVFRPNLTFMGSQNNWQSMVMEFRKYFKLSPNSKNVFAFWSYNWLTTGGKPPYLLLPATGWDDEFNIGRGYIQGRFRGRNMVYLEAEYRFQISRNGLLGGVLFANAQSISNERKVNLNVINPAVGTGLRIKLNKYSGSNLCIDYGIGLNGSKGFFVNLNEVF